MKKSLFCLSLFSLLLCGCNNTEANNKDEFEKDNPVVEEKDNKEEIVEDNVPRFVDDKTFSFRINNEDAAKLNKTFSHQDKIIITDIESYNSFDNTFTTLLNSSDEKSNHEIKLPTVDFAKEDIAVATYCEENSKSNFNTRVSGSITDMLIVTASEEFIEEGNCTSFGIYYAILQKEIAHDIRLTYVNHEDTPTSWRAGD